LISTLLNLDLGTQLLVTIIAQLLVAEILVQLLQTETKEREPRERKEEQEARSSLRACLFFISSDDIFKDIGKRYCAGQFISKTNLVV